jgi:hypothetical protein
MESKRLTPGEAIRETCKDCVENLSEIHKCGGDTLVTGPCPFYKYRLGRGRPSVKTIRRYCMYCMGGTSNLVKECKTIKCPLYEFRLGKNPAYKKLSPAILNFKK